MICINCSTAADNSNPDLHNLCQGLTQCDCQHKIGPNHVQRPPKDSTDQKGDTITTHRD